MPTEAYGKQQTHYGRMRETKRFESMCEGETVLAIVNVCAFRAQYECGITSNNGFVSSTSERECTYLTLRDLYHSAVFK